MALVFDEYRAKRVLNVQKHVDGGWFWCKYSAYPYVGCRSGCEFCYSRGSRYLGREDPDSFDRHIRVKLNAVERLRAELGRRPPDVIACGDWQQPAEKRYRLSRGMLGVVLELGVPLVIIERSPLVARDLDLLREIHARTAASVLFSMSSVDPVLKRAFEPRSPGTRARLGAMERIAAAGVPVGTSLMPVLPVIGDSRQHLADAVRATADHGGSFLLAGGLTMDGVQAERSLAAARRLDPSLEGQWRELFGWRPGGKPSYGPPRDYWIRIAWQVRELCEAHGITDRMPRPVPARWPLAGNKRLAEQLFLKVYDLELEQSPSSRVWAYRRAAWTVDEWPECVPELYRDRGLRGLRELPGIGQALAGWIGAAIERMPEIPAGDGGRPVVPPPGILPGTEVVLTGRGPGGKNRDGGRPRPGTTSWGGNRDS